jgi:hypothetical protein
VLSPSASNAGTPPWWCPPCRVYYWVAELSQQARESYRYGRHDFGYQNEPGFQAVRAAVENELAEAKDRGVSLRREQIGLVPPATLDALLARFKVRPDFADLMRRR